jgi:signal transduction histidine kinase
MRVFTRTATLGSVKLVDSARARLRAMDPFHADIALAAVFVVAGVVELSLIDSQGESRLPTIAAGVIALSSVAFRRRDALIAALVFLVPAIAQAFIGGYFTTASTTPFVAILFLLFSFGRYAPAPRFQVAAGLLSVGMTATIFIEDAFEASEIFWVIFLFGLPLLAGRALRSRALLQAELREKAERAEAERDWRAGYAVEEERQRIAGELQTLVANGLSAMVVQAETVPRAIATGDSGGAAVALTAVEETGRDALSEMRRLLGVLRRDDDGAELAPQPGLPRVLAFVERIRERGLPVEVTIEGRDESKPRRLSPGVDLTAYRVVEDALEAALEHGASEARLLVRYTPEELRLQISDDREGGASDRLPGLRDRVGLYGGHLSAGRPDEGGFRLRARLPIEVAV